MKNIIRFLKPFKIMLLIAVSLLAVQAVCELSLPYQMSSIVNVGIQQNGINGSSPEAISEQGYEFATAFMNEDEKSLVQSAYEIKSGDDLLDLYPNAAGETVYVRKDNVDIDAVNSAFGYGLWTAINAMQNLTADMPTSSTEDAEMSAAQFYEALPILSTIPQESIDTARNQTEALYGATIGTSASIFVSLFYEELGVNLGSIQQSYIIQIGLIMIGLTAISGITTISANLFSSKISAGVARDMRSKLFDKINKFSNKEFDKFSTSSLITRSTNDVTQVQMLLTMGIRFLFYSPLMVIGGVVMAMNKSLSMAWIIALACILLIGMLSIIISIVLPKSKLMQKLIDKLNLVSRETLNGLMVIRAFGTEKYEKDRFDKTNKSVAKTNLSLNRATTFMFPLMMLIMNGTSLLIVWVGSEQVAQSNIQIGDIMAYIQYAMQIIMSFLMMTMMFVFLPRAIVSANRIGEVLDTEVSVQDPVNPKPANPSLRGVLEFKNVSFKYDSADESAIENINFTANPGQTIAFIGATGSGKSTLLNLIPRFYDVTQGEILVSGVNVKDLSLQQLHSMLGYVPQKSVLMTGTIAENISYGKPDINQEQIEKSAKIAQALDFINDKEDGMNSDISQGGSNVSGGQRQRLSIARALAINPDIYLFDDSFSALDFKTDATLRKALNDNISNATIIIVAQRVNTILNADKIFVLDEGKIIDSGTHKELLKSCQTYYEIASTQLSKEELSNE